MDRQEGGNNPGGGTTNNPGGSNMGGNMGGGTGGNTGGAQEFIANQLEAGGTFYSVDRHQLLGDPKAVMGDVKRNKEVIWHPAEGELAGSTR
jgi:hypothetical protein